MPSKRRVTAIASGAALAVLGALHLKRKNQAKANEQSLYEPPKNGSSPIVREADSDVPSASYQL